MAGPPAAHEPLIWTTKQAVFALNPATGALRWRANLPRLHRLFRLGSRLFALTIEGVISLDMSSGERLGQTELAFVPTIGIVTPSHLFVASSDGAAALSPTGAVLWSINQEQATSESPRQFYACQGRDGYQLWREEASGDDGSPGLLLGERVAPPESDST
jgi:outer membrane protein assembly factor BamB